MPMRGVAAKIGSLHSSEHMRLLQYTNAAPRLCIFNDENIVKKLSVATDDPPVRSNPACLVAKNFHTSLLLLVSGTQRAIS